LISHPGIALWGILWLNATNNMAGGEQGPGQSPRLPQGVTNAFDKIRRRFSPEQPTEEDSTWAEYMGKKRDWRELAVLACNHEVQPAFQQRAIEVLLAPDITRLPFPVNVETGLNNYTGLSGHWTEKLTDIQAAFVAERIPDYIQQAGQAIQRNEHNCEATDALLAYNDLIPKLLGKLPPEQAEQLFESFSINDLLTYMTIESASGYNPLQGLYHDTTVDESWKRRAATQMHEVIEREQRGESQPRAEHEGAAGNYEQTLRMMLHEKESLPVSREFYQEEIEFMLGVETDRPIVSSWQTGEVLDLLDDAELRHKFARRQVLSGEPDSFGRFKIYDDAREEIARRIIGEFPEDADMRTYLEQQLQEYVVRAAEQREHQAQEAAREQTIFDRMRNPSV
jgi:hypothetical protein